MAWNVPSTERAETLARIAEVVRRAEDYDIPVMLEPIVVGEGEDGARGIVIGRNVWQRPPDVTRRLMQRLHEIVHG